MSKVNKVLYNVDQRNDTTSTEKQTARDNIGAGTSNVSVKHTTSPTVPPVETNVDTVTIYDDGRLKFGNAFNAAIPPEPVQGQAGLILQAGYAGSPARGFLNFVDVHSLVREVPVSTAAASGCVLTVDSSGNPAWSASSSGLPTHTASDTLKVLTIDNSNNVVWGYKDPILYNYSDSLSPTFRDDPSGWQFEAAFSFDTGATYKQYSSAPYARKNYPVGSIMCNLQIKSAKKTNGNIFYMLDEYYNGTSGHALIKQGTIQLVNSPTSLNAAYADITYIGEVRPSSIPTGFKLYLYTDQNEFTTSETIDVSCHVSAILNDGIM